MTSILKTVFIVLLIYFGFRFLLKLLTPFLLGYISKRAGRQFGFFMGNSASDFRKSSGKRNSATIDKMPGREKKSKSYEGEYIDFEEIE